MITITTTWHNDNPNTIWNQLACRLGRQPTNDEAETEVRRILRDEPATESARPQLRVLPASPMEGQS